MNGVYALERQRSILRKLNWDPGKSGCAPGKGRKGVSERKEQQGDLEQEARGLGREYSGIKGTLESI